jgi:F-type H+-transporting ATPase subunit a
MGALRFVFPAVSHRMPQITIHAEQIFKIGGFPVTNSLALSAAVFLVLAVLALVFRRKVALVPAGFQNLVEMLVDGALDMMDSVLGDRQKSEKYLPFVLTVFLFVMVSNWFGLIPGVGSLLIRTPEGTVPFFRSPAADLNFTLALALIAVTFVNVFGVAAIGFKARARTFFNFKGPIEFFVGILELVSEFAKIISFSFRLFGNVFAGEVLLTIIAFLVPYAAPLPFLFLEIFVGFIQAFIFAMLTLVFVSMATAEHGEHEAGTQHA